MAELTDPNEQFDRRINLELLRIQLLLILINFTPVQEVFDSFGISQEVFNNFLVDYNGLLDMLSNPNVAIPHLTTLDTVLLPNTYIKLLSDLLPEYQVTPDWEAQTPETQFYLLEYCLMRLYIILDFNHGDNPILSTRPIADLLKEPGSNSDSSKKLIMFITGAINELIRPIQLEVANSTLAKMLYQRGKEVDAIFGTDLEYAHPQLIARFEIIKSQGGVNLTSQELKRLQLQVKELTLQPLNFYAKKLINERQITLNRNLIQFIQNFQLDQ